MPKVVEGYRKSSGSTAFPRDSVGPRCQSVVVVGWWVLVSQHDSRVLTCPLEKCVIVASLSKCWIWGLVMDIVVSWILLHSVNT